MTASTSTAATTTASPSTRRRIAGGGGGYSRDSVYFLLFIVMMVYHFYSNHSVLMLSPSSVPANGGNDAEVASIFPSFPNRSKSNSSATTRDQSRPIPLDTLTLSRISECPDGLIYLPNRLIPNHNNATARKIPKLVHMTSKSRCFTPNFAANIHKWEFEGHEMYIHDDEAVERLLGQTSHWATSFPHLSLARKCLRSGAGLADLWRYLVLWEYGGIYTDIDNAPGKFWTSDTIRPEDDAFFVIEKLGVLSQYFIAVSPKHPLMYLAVHLSLSRLLDLDHVGKQNIPVVTGPGALKVAFKYFMRTQEILSGDDERKWKAKHPNGTRYGRVKAGTYYGVGNRSVTIAGTKETASRLVIRGSVYGKGEGYKKMGMKHFSAIAKKKFNESCLVHLWNIDYDSNFNMTNW